MECIDCNLVNQMLQMNVDENVGLTEVLFMMKPNVTSFRNLFQAYKGASMKDNILKLCSDSPEVSGV